MTTQIGFDDVFTFNNLVESANIVERGVKWKYSTQMFDHFLGEECLNLYDELHNGTYEIAKQPDFYLNERGKIRHIEPLHIRDRCVQKTLIRLALKPIIIPKLIYDNGASLEGKGIDFSIKRLTKHLTHHYAKYGKKGGILTMDYHAYFDSIDHKLLLSMYKDAVKDDKLYSLIEQCINYFNSNYGLGLGAEISQLSALYYINDLDHFIKEKLRINGYGRYMDDSYIISDDIDYLKYCLDILTEKAKYYNLSFNPKHTRITKFNSGENFTFLKKRIFISDTGKIVMKITNDNVRRHKKHIRNMYRKGVPIDEIINSHQCWKSYARKYNSNNKVRKLDEYIEFLYHDDYNIYRYIHNIND